MQVLAGNNTNVSHYLRLRFPSPYTRDDALAWLTNTTTTTTTNNNHNVSGICLDDHVIGVISIEPLQDVHRHTAELGYVIPSLFSSRN